MISNIEVIRHTDEQHRQVWRFVFLDSRKMLVVSSYSNQSRTSPRHKWITDDYYERLRPSRFEAKEVPLPEDIKQEAKQKMMDMIEVSVD